MSAVAAAPVATAPKLRRFQVLAGSHWEPREVVDPETGHKRVRDVPFGPGRPAGDIVETSVDLCRRFNRPGSVKFRDLGEENDPVGMEIKAERAARLDAETRLRAAFEAMTARSLIEYAEKQGWDLMGATSKEKVLPLVLQYSGLPPAVPA